MGRRDSISNFQMFGAGGDMSQATLTSPIPADVSNMDLVEIQVSWSGTSPIGSLVVQRSRDGINYIPFDFGQTISISGNTGTHTIILNDFKANKIQLVYTKTSGTGTLLASLGATQVGG